MTSIQVSDGAREALSEDEGGLFVNPERLSEGTLMT